MGGRKGKSAAKATTVRGKSEGREMNQDQLRLALPACRVSVRKLSKGLRPIPQDPRIIVRGYKWADVFGEVQGQGRVRQYPEVMKLAIGKMAVERSVKDSLLHFSRELGFQLNYQGVSNFKRLYMEKRKEENQNGKNGEGDEQVQGGEEQAQGGENQDQGGMGQVNAELNLTTGEVFTTNQEQEETSDADEEGEGIQVQDSAGGGSSTKVSFKEGDYLKQVKEQEMDGEEDEDLSVEFDTRAVYKETSAIAAMRKYQEVEKEIQVRKEVTRLLEVEREELARKLARELAKGQLDAM